MFVGALSFADVIMAVRLATFLICPAIRTTFVHNGSLFNRETDPTTRRWCLALVSETFMRFGSVVKPRSTVRQVLNKITSFSAPWNESTVHTV
jgi:hypothetical protein